MTIATTVQTAGRGTHTGPRTQRERRETTRQRLLDATVRVIADLGYPGCTFAAVAGRAGMTTGALQHHFGTKSELLEAVLAERLLPVTRMRRRASQAGKPLRARCRAVVEQGWALYGDEAYPVVWDIVLGAREDPDLQEHIIAWQREAAEAGLADTKMAFDGLGLKPAQLRELSLFYAAQLRGLALLRPFQYDSRVFKRQLKVLADAIESYVRSLLGHAGEPQD